MLKMPDRFPAEVRSQIMSAIQKTGNRSTELAMARLLRKYKIRGWRRHQHLPGNPDFAFRRDHLVLFVDGCFWHQCPLHSNMPVQNREYWLPKLRSNHRRDLEIGRILRAAGWTVIRVWEHELDSPHKVAARVRAALSLAVQHVP